MNPLRIDGRTMAALLFWSPHRQTFRPAPFFGPRSSFAERLFRLARKDTRMRQFGALLRATRSRIGRRLADIVAIAAASLPAVGA
jgi:hypothetical protein